VFFVRKFSTPLMSSRLLKLSFFTPMFQIVVMASGPLPPGGPHTGLKLFVYGVGRTRNNAEVNFLAQVSE